MPSHKPVKTYQKKTRIETNSNTKSVDAINALFAENLTKRLRCRKKANLKLKELPPRVDAYLTDESLKVEPNNTFDKLAKGKVYNKVKVCNLMKNNSSTETSKSKSQINVSFHSPIMTRRRKKSSVVIQEMIEKKVEKSSTFDKPITSSLSIEKENKTDHSSLSYIKLPKITENEVLSKPIFSDTFRERNTVHSSTPYVSAPTKRIITDPISPITKSDSSTSSKLIEKSYDEIRKWDKIFPPEDLTPKRSVLRSGKKIGLNPLRKLSIVDDWKLRCQPRVYLTKFDADIVNFKGFNKKEQSDSSEGASRIQSWLGLDLDNKAKNVNKHKGKIVKRTRRKSKKSEAVEDLRGFSDEEQEISSRDSNRVNSMLESMSKSYIREEISQRNGKLNKTRSKNKKSKKVVTPVKRSLRKRQPTLKYLKYSLLSPKVAKKIDTVPSTFTIENIEESPILKRIFSSPPQIRKKICTENEQFSLKSNGGKRFVNLRTRKKITSTSRKSKMKKSVDVTDDILLEKEMSYSSSFDFTSDASKISCSGEESRHEEIGVLKNENDGITVNLKDFDNFVDSYYNTQKEKLKNESVISVISISDESVIEDSVNVENSTSKSHNPKHEADRLSLSKIVILSDITLGANNKPVDGNVTLQDIVVHDHSYASPAKAIVHSFSRNDRMSLNPRDQEVSFLSDIIESSIVEDLPKRKTKPKSIRLKPGKSYRRSLSLLRRSSVVVDVQKTVCSEDCVCLKCIFKEKLKNLSRRSSQIVPASRNADNNQSILENYARQSIGYVQEEDKLFENLDESVRNLSLNASRGVLKSLITAKEVVLRRCCQTEILPFEECYSPSALQHCQKIGEGVYGEVFLYRNQNGTSVMKIIPIEGDLIVNGERQKKFEEILSEIVIAMELSYLRTNKKNCTNGFTAVQKARCTQGNYPDRLLDLWDLYDETKGSENDSPQMFSTDQMYIVLELANGGQDLESFIFNNAMQAYAMFKQTACALAVAETQLKFEHRDLHWGNILINRVDKNKTLNFRLNGKEIQVDTLGVEIAIIDFTLSRIEFDGVVIYNDLSLDDELFVAKGDYQFEIYRLMQKSNGNEWRHFEPYTNILWLHYLLDKVPELRYKNPRSKVHKEYTAKIRKMKDEVLSYNSVADFVKDKFF